MTRWTLRNTNSPTAIGGKAHIASATRMSRPDQRRGARQDEDAEEDRAAGSGRSRGVDGGQHDRVDLSWRHRPEDSIGPARALPSRPHGDRPTPRNWPPSRCPARGRWAVRSVDRGRGPGQHLGRDVAAADRRRLRLAPADRRRRPRDRVRPEDRCLQLADRGAAVPCPQLGVGCRHGRRIPFGRIDGYEPRRAAHLGPCHRFDMVAARAGRAEHPAIPAVVARGRRGSSSGSRSGSPRSRTWDVVFVLAIVLAWSLWLRRGSRPALIAVPIITALWGNLHGAAAFGFVLCLVWRW